MTKRVISVSLADYRADPYAATAMVDMDTRVIVVKPCGATYASFAEYPGEPEQPYTEAASCTHSGCDHGMHHCRIHPTSGRLLSSKPVRAHAPAIHRPLTGTPDRPTPAFAQDSRDSTSAHHIGKSLLLAITLAVATAAYVVGWVW